MIIIHAFLVLLCNANVIRYNLTDEKPYIVGNLTNVLFEGTWKSS